MITPGTEQEPDHSVVLAVGGSAGSMGPLIEVVRDLPEDLPASVLVTIHLGEQTRLPQILSRSGPLPAAFATDHDVLEPARIYVAPRGRHLIAGDGLALLSPGPRMNGHRPAVDVMFASAAEWSAARTVGVVLSGALDDGAVGAALIDLAGGQSRMRAEMDMIGSDDPAFLREDETRLTRLTCPECGGGLAQVDLPTISYFRCHVGHQHSPQTLAAVQAEVSEKKLWSAVAALEEQAGGICAISSDRCPPSMSRRRRTTIRLRTRRTALSRRLPAELLLCGPRYVRGLLTNPQLDASTE